MDYKELIEQLRSAFPGSGYELERSVCESAADAIETLLAERDALLAEIRGECSFCAFETGACVGCDDGDCWEWRGPQKEGDSDA